ncbi:MAG: hypothetical protein ACJ701_03340, partial [Nitrososphaera sp.]
RNQRLMTSVTFYFSPCLPAEYTQSIMSSNIAGPSGREVKSLQKVDSFLSIFLNAKRKVKRFC